MVAAGVGYAAGGASGADTATGKIYNNDYLDFQTRKVIRAKCAAGTTSAAGLPCAPGVVDHITTYGTDPKTGDTKELAYYRPYPSDYNSGSTVEVSVPIYSQDGAKERLSLRLRFQVAWRKNLGVELRTDKTSYRLGEKIIVEVLLTNHSSSPLYIYRKLDWGESSSFSLKLKDSDSGRSIPQRFFADALTPPPNSKNDFIRLLPDHIFGLQLKTTVDDLSLNKSGKYDLVVDYHSPIPSRLGFGLPIWSKEKGTIHSNSAKILITN